jgi:hypothetical protein
MLKALAKQPGLQCRLSASLLAGSLPCGALHCNWLLALLLLHVPAPSMWLLKPSLAFEAYTDPVDTSAQATLAPHQTTELKESADTTFMAM